jgi:hypothetical protein
VSLTHDVPDPTSAYTYDAVTGKTVFFPPTSPICYTFSAEEMALVTNAPVIIITNAEYPEMAITGSLVCGS